MNEQHDMAARRAEEMGFVADHARSAQEAGAESLFQAVVCNAFAGAPPLEESGLRVLIMAHRDIFFPGFEMSRKELEAMRKVAVQCNGGLRVPPVAEPRPVYELIIGGETSAWRIGRRASLLAYALSRNVIVREALPSFERIGELWELQATNKRSAVCAAMNKLRGELVRCGQLPSGFRFWFEKSADARLVYEQAQIGNQNRHGHAPDVYAHAEEGLPLKPRFARMKPQERRRVLNELHERAEMRRLGVRWTE